MRFVRFADKSQSDSEHRVPGKESKTLTSSDKDVEDLIVELLANHTIG